jgi:Isoprenylcysteine carboxyl methyltransferase (ICMT) family
VTATTQAPAPWLTWLSRRRIDIGTIAVVGLLPFTHPTPGSIAAFLPVVVAGLVLRTWARGVFEPQRELARTGPYAFIRHPLYVGSFLIGFGCAAMTRDARVVLAFVGAFLLMYVPRIRREEMSLRRRHGDAHARYVAGVGAVFPRAMRAATDPDAGGPVTAFAWHRVFRHCEWRTWLGTVAVVAVFWVRAGGLSNALSTLEAAWADLFAPSTAAARRTDPERPPAPERRPVDAPRD